MPNVLASSGTHTTASSAQNDGGGNLYTGNWFYATAPITVTGMRLWNPSDANSAWLAEAQTAYLYVTDWAGGTIAPPVWASESVATAAIPGGRTAGTWTEVTFNAPRNVLAITNTAAGADAILLAVKSASGNMYSYVSTANSGFSSDSAIGSGAAKLAEDTFPRSMNSLSTGGAAGNPWYGVDLTWEPQDGGGGPTDPGEPSDSEAINVTVTTTTLNPVAGTAVPLTVTTTPTSTSPVLWEITDGAGTLSATTGTSITFTPNASGRHVVRATVGGRSGSAWLYVGAPPAAVTGTLNATVADPLNATDAESRSRTVTRGGAPHYLKRSLFGARSSYGDQVVNRAGLPEAVSNNGFGRSIGVTFRTLRAVDLTGARFLKPAALAGTITVELWRHANQTRLFSKRIEVAATPAPEWVTVRFDQPVELEADPNLSNASYILTYHSPTGEAMQISYGFNTQPVVEYPLTVGQNGGGFGDIDGSANTYQFEVNQPANTYPTSRGSQNYMIEPLVEWRATDYVYTGGTEYYKQWTKFSDIDDWFPFGLWQPLPETTPNLPGFGVNLAVTLGQGENNLLPGIQAIIDTGLKVIAPNLSALHRDNQAFFDLTVGSLVADEPDMFGDWGNNNADWTLARLQEEANNVHRRDGSIPAMFNFGRWTTRNKGYAHRPTASNMYVANAAWREWARATDIISVDDYMEDPANSTEGGDGMGLWCNPVFVKRLQALNDNRTPVWGYVATATYPDEHPTPDLVKKSIWAWLIGGARGIVLFDTVFTRQGGYVTSSSMETRPDMATAMLETSNLIQSIRTALFAEELNARVTWTSSNKTAGPVGGTWGVPLHYAHRQDATYYYLLTQAIRPGTTNATWTVPSAAGKTVTVLGENRTVTANGSGLFSDTYSSDYAYHLYRWTK